jgi:hypothetical protein
MLFRVLTTTTLLLAFSLATAAAHPNLGADAFDFDLERKLDLEVQFDQSNPKTGHLEFAQDEAGAWSLAVDPNKYHGPDGVDADYLFVDRDEALADPVLKALRKGNLPLLRALPTEDGENYSFEFATPVEISQFVWPSLDTESDAGPELSFYSDIAGTMQIAPIVNQAGYPGQSAAYTLIVPQVRRIVVAARAQSVIAQNTGGQGGQPGIGETQVSEPSGALLLLPGLAAIYVVRRRRRGADSDECEDA